MNTILNLDSLFSGEVVTAPKTFLVPQDNLPRCEKCPMCDVYLVEHVIWKSSKPANAMRVQLGRKHRSWPVSESIFCPKCRMVFKHDGTNTEILEKYFAVGKSVYAVMLKEPFEVSKFDTEIKKDIPKGTILYTSLKLSASSHNFLFQIKPEYTKSQGWTKAKPLIKGEPKTAFSCRIADRWDLLFGISCARTPGDLFEKSKHFLLPPDILQMTS